MRYLPLLERIDDWHAGARAANPGVIPCRAGCAACCHGPFDISVADAEQVRDAVGRLPEETRARVVERARAEIGRYGEQVPRWGPPHDIRSIGEEAFDRLSDALAELPCPALDPSGRCLIYAERPLVCRIMGLGLMTEAGFVIENECPIQNRFPEYADLAPVPFGLEAWETDESRAKAAAARRMFGEAEAADYETTVAGAILL